MRRLPITLTALAGTVTAGLLVTQTPILSAFGDDDYAKRDEDTPSVQLVDDEDDKDAGKDAGKDTGKDTGKDAGTLSRVTKDDSRADITRNSRVSRDDSVDRAPAPAAADDSNDRPSLGSRDQSADNSND